MRDDGGPAFPRTGSMENGRVYHDGSWNDGMSLLAWFAGETLKGTCANPHITIQSYKDMAEICFDQAEAMIAEMRKREKANE